MRRSTFFLCALAVGMMATAVPATQADDFRIYFDFGPGCG